MKKREIFSCAYCDREFDDWSSCWNHEIMCTEKNGIIAKHRANIGKWFELSGGNYFHLMGCKERGFRGSISVIGVQAHAYDIADIYADLKLDADCVCELHKFLEGNPRIIPSSEGEAVLERVIGYAKRKPEDCP